MVQEVLHHVIKEQPHQPLDYPKKIIPVHRAIQKVAQVVLQNVQKNQLPPHLLLKQQLKVVMVVVVFLEISVLVDTLCSYITKFIVVILKVQNKNGEVM